MRWFKTGFNRPGVKLQQSLPIIMYDNQVIATQVVVAKIVFCNDCCINYHRIFMRADIDFARTINSEQ